MMIRSDNCFEYDSFLEDQDRTLWVAETNQGRIYEDDGRPGFINSAWQRMIINQPKIKRLGLFFRDHYEWLPADKDGYYFVKSILFGPTMEKPAHFYTLGYLENNIIHCTEYKIPELIISDQFERLPEDGGETDYGPLLIVNYGRFLSTSD